MSKATEWTTKETGDPFLSMEALEKYVGERVRMTRKYDWSEPHQVEGRLVSVNEVEDPVPGATVVLYGRIETDRGSEVLDFSRVTTLQVYSQQERSNA